MSDASGGSLRAIVYALLANGGIAAAKFAAALYTGSGAMLAEAVHSLADCGNQGLLLLGMRRARRARRAPTADHPLGFGRVVYVYAMLVALLLFFAGGVFSLSEGWHRWQTGTPIEAPLVALAVLAVSIVLETISLRAALREIARLRAGRSLWRWFRETRESELLVVAGEDIAALAGLTCAFMAVGLAHVTGDPRWDAAGTLVIGGLLVVVAGLVMREVAGMMVGESVERSLRDALAAHIAAQPEVRRVRNLITLQWGAEMVVAVQAEMVPQDSATALVDAINRVEASIQARWPQARWVFFEPDHPDAEDGQDRDHGHFALGHDRGDAVQDVVRADVGVHPFEGQQGAAHAAAPAAGAFGAMPR